jgi:hypothetical protein
VATEASDRDTESVRSEFQLRGVAILDDNEEEKGFVKEINLMERRNTG